MKTLHMVKNKCKSVTIQGNITAMRYRNDVIWSVQIHANLGLLLVWDYASCHAAKSTLVMLIADNVQNSDGLQKVWI